MEDRKMVQPVCPKGEHTDELAAVTHQQYMEGYPLPGVPNSICYVLYYDGETGEPLEYTLCNGVTYASQAYAAAAFRGAPCIQREIGARHVTIQRRDPVKAIKKRRAKRSR